MPSGLGHPSQVAIFRIVTRRENESVEMVLIDSLKLEYRIFFPLKCSPQQRRKEEFKIRIDPIV